MKNCFTLSHLFKMAGRKGDAFGTTDACIYFDGQRALAANQDATLWIDCPQPLARPILVPVGDLKTALMISPTLSLTDIDGRITANGVKVEAYGTTDVIPETTLELINLDREVWHSIVKPFKFDGSRLAQVAPAAADGDLRYYLNGVYFDFASGALVATDGRRMHIVEDALPTTLLPTGTLEGVVLPGPMARLLAGVNGVQDVFVLQRISMDSAAPPVRATPQAAAGPSDEAAKPAPLTPPRMICIAVANAKFRIRAIATDDFPRYRVPFERNREHPVQMVLAAADTPSFAAVAKVAARNANFPGVTIAGAGRRISVSHRDRIEIDLSVGYAVGDPFTATVNGTYLLDAINAAGNFGSAVTLRYSREDARGVYIGALDFHSIVMTMTETDESSEGDASDTGATASLNPLEA